MKIYIFLILSFVLLTSCKEETSSNLNQIEAKLKTDNSSTSEFILKNDTVLKGKLGTKIFIPKDLFENYTNGKITLELKEFYSKEDMILNGLSTVTDKDELLESSGMFYINFTENGKQLIIAEGKKYSIIPAEEILDKSAIYYNDNDSLFNWNKSNEKVFVEIEDLLGIYNYVNKSQSDVITQFFTKTVLKDSVEYIKKSDSLKYVALLRKAKLDYYEKIFINNSDELIEAEFPQTDFTNDNTKKHNKLTPQQKELELKKRETFFNKESEINSFTSSRLGWINIDRLVDITKEINLEIELSDYKNVTNISIYYIYSDMKSFYRELFNSQPKFTRPFSVAGETKVVVVSNNDKDSYLYDLFYINVDSKTKHKVDLKTITLDKLKKVLTTK